MERNREAVPMAAAGNGFSRRRHRAGSFRDSPEEEGPVEFPEAARVRDRGGGSTKKDRERDRDRERERDRFNSRSKRRRGERLFTMEGDLYKDGCGEDEDTSDESVDADEEYDDSGLGPPSSMKMLPPESNNPTASFSSALTNHHNGLTGNLYNQRKSFHPSKVFRLSPATTPPPPASPVVSSWKPADEMIGVSVPRKARSACTKRSHESWTSSATVFASGEQIHRQTSAASTLASPSPPPAPLSPSSSNVLLRKKITPGPKHKPLPPKSPVAQDEIEIEIAEVLYGMMKQPSKQEAAGNDSGEKVTVEVKFRASSPMFNLQTQSSNVSAAIAPKRKRPRVVKHEEDTISNNENAEDDEDPSKTEGSGSTGEKLSALDSTNPQQPSSGGRGSKLEPEKKENVVSREEKSSPPPEMESSSAIRSDGDVTISSRVVKASLRTPEKENIEINLMTPSQSRSSPRRDGDIECVAECVAATEAKPKVTIVDSEEAKEVEKFGCKEALTLKPELEVGLKKSDQLSGSDKAAQASSLPLHMSIPGWLGGIPAMGYLGPTQGVMPTDASSLPCTTMQPPHLFFNQPRPKRCATHSYIARNISYHQRFTKMNSFWPAAAGVSAPLYGSKACNLSLMPPAGPNSVPDKSSQSTPNCSDITDQRKQILLQQTLPPGAGNNILHGPTFIIPLGQQPHAAAAIAAASVRPPNTGNTVASSGATATLASMNGSASAAPAGATTMSFSYPNMPANEAQYLAILQKNGYPFPVPAHVGAPPAYRGVNGQPIPFFNGSFYSSQMVHAQHLQPQQQSGSINQNTNVATGSSAAQKHLQSQQRRPPVNSQGIPTQKVQSQPLSFQQRQHPRENATQHSETARGDSPSAADSRAVRSNVAYGQNLAMPMQQTNMVLMGSAASTGVVVGSSNNHGEKKQEQQGSKVAAESIQSQPYAMTFATFNGGVNMPSIAQNHAIYHGVPETTRQGYNQMMAAAVAAQAAKQKMNHSAPEDGKSGSNATEERKTTGANGKTTTPGVGQSVDSADASASAATGGCIIDSSARLLNLGSAQPWSSNSAPTSHQQQHMQRNQSHQQYSNYLQMQQQYAVAAARGKGPVMSNGSVFSNHSIATAPSMGTNAPNASSGFSQHLVQSGGGNPAQSPHWKNNSPRANAMAQSQSTSTLSPSASSSLKNVQQKQQSRPQQSQISFGANSKTLPCNSPMQQGASGGANQAQPISTSSVSKNAGGSPRTTHSTSMANKAGHGQASSSTLSSSQPSKNSQSASSAGGRNNGQSILGNPHNTSTTSNPISKSQQQQHLQQAQLFFSSPYMQPQHHQQQQMNISPASGYYIQRHQQQQVGSSAAATSVTLSSCTTVTSDPLEANTMIGGGNNNNLQLTQGAGKTHQQQQLVPPGFPYVHAVQVKPGDQKQHAGE